MNENDIEELHIARAQEQPQKKAYPKWVYAILFVVFDFGAMAILQQGVSQSSTRTQLSSPLIGLGTFISRMWTHANFVALLNMLIIAVVYLILIMLINRFWIATGVLMAVSLTIAVIEHFKVEIRYESILPSDLNFLKSNTGDLMSFMPPGAHWTILLAVAIFAAIVVLLFFLRRADGSRGKIIRTSNGALNAIIRILVIAFSSLLLVFYVGSVGTAGSWAQSFTSFLGDRPSMWDSVYDAQRNGPLVSFLRQLRPKIMTEPEGYSQETMEQLAQKYATQATQINKSRSQNLTDNTVVFVLSESFSDPTRVPGVSVSKDPMPKIREIKEHTTSGLMLSSGYGGGTANLEYMGLSGMSMANFDASLTSPYQQLVPQEHWTPTVNQMWGAPRYSLGFHPYEPSMYSRSINYKKFGFSKFYALQGPDIIAHQDKIDKSPYVSDEASYQSALEKIENNSDNQFIQIITMQNHMPYNQWYKNNEFKISSSKGSPAMNEDELSSIQTYTKGVEITDDATQKFLDNLDKVDKPITVVFYGDHLPGIYATASENKDNSLALHLTDYFIWSNKASRSAGVKAENSQYSSPNFFIAQAAQHMDAKVSPFLAFLTQMREAISAMEPPVVNNIQGWDRIPEGQPIYLDSQGKPMAHSDMDAHTQELLNDYKLIQYDITAGKNYLKNTSFMKLP